MLQRFRPDDPAFVSQIETRLKDAVERADVRRGGLLSVTLATPEIPCAGLPAIVPGMIYWGRPSEKNELFGMGGAAWVEAEGSGRWSRLKEAFEGWRGNWRHEDVDSTGLRPLALGGFAFSDQSAAAGTLPAARLAVPDLLLRRQGETCALTFTFNLDCGGVALQAALDRLQPLLESLGGSPAPEQGGGVLRRVASGPDDEMWLERAQQAARDIHSGKLDKVVLTRRVTVSAERDFDPARVLSALARRYAACTLFAAQTPQGGVFLGASPEILARLQSGEVYCDALAGTAWGSSRAASATGTSLLADIKNGREHRLVVQAIAEALRPLCSTLEVPNAPKILHLGHLHHIWSTLRGNAKPGVNLLDLLRRLHPTPAVGGYPRQAALDWLAQQHEIRGGWYTGAIGWLDSEGEGEFAVALRCAHIHGNLAELYAGAGIVAGSDPRHELAETEAKLAPMLHALGRSGGGHG